MERIYSFSRYILFFLAYSVLGTLAETLYRLATEHHVYGIHGFLHIPILPIYGFGALMIIFLLEKLRRKPFLLFIVATLLLSLLEFIAHWVIEALFHVRIWDYSADPFNLAGRIDLYSSIGFGLLAVLLINGIHPLFRRAIKHIPNYVTIVIAGIILIVLLVDAVISVVGHMK